MTTLFIVLILIFISIAIWQMIKIFDLSRAISGLNKEVRPGIYIDEKGNRVRPPLVGNSVLNQVRMMKAISKLVLQSFQTRQTKIQKNQI